MSAPESPASLRLGGIAPPLEQQLPGSDPNGTLDALCVQALRLCLHEVLTDGELSKVRARIAKKAYANAKKAAESAGGEL